MSKRVDYANAWYRSRLNQLREARGNQCETCHRSLLVLHFAHVKPTALNGRGRGRNARIRDIERHPEAYRLVCKRCHFKMDGLKVILAGGL